MAWVPRPFTLYPTSLFMYEDCPQQFLWSKGWKTIDLGRGPGRGKERPIKKSEHHAVLGIAIQAVVEKFYNDEMYKTMAPPDLRDHLLKLGEEALNLELARKYIDWRDAPTRDEMKLLVRNALMGYMRTLKAHKLLGPYSRAEVDLVAYIDKDNPVGGRADLIIRREDTGTTIIDGKNGKRYKDPKDKTKTKWITYTDPDQLRYYAMVYFLCYHKLPDRLGFVFYRYPYGDEVMDASGNKVVGAVEPGVDWVPFTMDDIKGLAQRAVDARAGMEAEKFEARPEPSKCRLCDFETVCKERLAQKEANRRGPKKGDPLADHPDMGSGGIVQLGFGPVKGSTS